MNMETRAAFELYALNIDAREKLTNPQERAIDLYKRGFNVFPIPYGCKEPFAKTSLKRLYNSRLHLCGDGVNPCRHSMAAPTFTSLFAGQKNIACMCGKTSGNLLAIDCDSQESFAQMARELDSRGLSYWALTSHRGGCYLLRVIEGEVVNVPKANSKFKDVELWGNSHYVILPLSVHPKGTVYRWRGDGDPRYQLATEYETLPAVSVTALDWLGGTLLKDDKRKTEPLNMFGLSSTYAALSEPNRDTLAHGANDGERNNRLTALAYDLAGNKFVKGEVESDFLRAASLCNPSYSQWDALAILRSAYRKSRTPARKDNCTRGPTVKIQWLYSFANTFDWKGTFGRKARTRRELFLVCIGRAEVEGEVFRATVRELAELVNRSCQYVSVCLRDLCDKKLLRLVVSWRESASGGNVYAFGKAVSIAQKKDSNPPTCNTNVVFLRYEKSTYTDAWKDVFGLKGLGAMAMDVFRVLQVKKYISLYAIAKDMKAPESSVRHAVKRLMEYSLVIHNEGLYYAEPVTDTELLALSVKLGTNGRAELKRIRHDIDRELFLNWNLAKAIRQYNGVTGKRW